MNTEPITIHATINASLDQVWTCWTTPAHITKWCFASDDWQAPRAENDLQVGATFMTRMEAKNGTGGFDFGGTYTALETNALIEYLLDDGRTVSITFEQTDAGVLVTETFDPEQENPAEMQRSGWQAILDNFTKYCQSTSVVDNTQI